MTLLMVGWNLYMLNVMNPSEPSYWNHWIDNDDVGIYKLMDYKSIYLTIRRLDLETHDPGDSDKYRLCISGNPLSKLFKSPLQAKTYAKDFIDNSNTLCEKQ